MNEKKINYNIHEIETELIQSGFLQSNMRIIFVIGAYILIETYTGVIYKYEVYNAKEEMKKYLFFTRKPLRESRHDEIAEKIQSIFKESKGSDKEAVHIPDDDEVKDVEAPETKKAAQAVGSALKTVVSSTEQGVKTEDLLRQVFEEILPQYGYSIRQGQIELAGEMLSALKKCNISLSEAGVGLGKTHGYIIASILNSLDNKNFNRIRVSYPLNEEFHKMTKMPTVISTSSIALQKAIAYDYIPEISKILIKSGLIKKPLSSVIRKGKEHYACDKRLMDYITGCTGNNGNAVQENHDEEYLLKEIQNAGFLDIDLSKYDKLRSYTKSRINVSIQCNAKCSCYNSCRYQKLIKHSKSYQHDFQICNHNYFLADIRHRSKGVAPLIPNYQAVIIDEAHKFLGAARQMYGNTISKNDIPHQLHYISKMKFKQSQTQRTVQSYCERLDKQNYQLFRALLKPVMEYMAEDDAERYKTEITYETVKNIKSIIYALESLVEILGDKSCFKGPTKSLHHYVMRSLVELVQRLKSYIDHSKIVYWIEIPSNINEEDPKEVMSQNVSLCSIPKNLNNIIYKDVWSKTIPMILTSGTISVNGCFSHIKKNMGLDKIQSVRLDEGSKASPFDYEENSLLYIPDSIPYPDNKDINYIKAVAGEVERLIKATSGHTVVLFTSYRVMEQVYNLIIKKELQYPVIKMSKGYTNPIDTFKKSENGILMASGNCWEGIDIPGDILSSLIIVKLPFAVPDPISDYEQTLYDNFDEYKNAVVFPDMIIKLKQGVGRLIRTEQDSGVISVLDSRVKAGGNYRDRVLKALPVCRVTSSIDEVEKFIKQKKDPSYF